MLQRAARSLRAFVLSYLGTRAGERQAKCKAVDDPAGEQRQGVVARAHDHDAIAGTCPLDQRVAASRAIRKSERFSTATLYRGDDVAAADRAFHRTAEID